MKKMIVFLAFGALITAACNDEKKPLDTSIIDKTMAHQQDAWNAGNIDGFMDAYWKSDSLLFIGKKGVTKGWNQTLANYKKSYPDKSAMGRLEFEVINQEAIGKKGVYTIGKWTLFRTADTLGGHFTLLWKKVNGNWKIVADHTS